MYLRVDMRPFVDSDVPASDFEGRTIPEEEWKRIMNEDLMNYAKYDADDPKFRIARIKIIKRIATGERSQKLWNDFLRLV